MGLFLKRTERIAASWEESGASDTLKALTAFVLCIPSPHTEEGMPVQVEIQLTGLKIAIKLLFCFRSLFQENELIP